MTLQLLANEPLTDSSTLYSRTFIDDITSITQNQTFTISAVGGFDTAEFTIMATRDELQDWFDDGLMRRIEFINPEGVQIWEGYVNRMRYSVGTLVETKTVETLFNRVYMHYAPLDFSVFPPIAGPPQDLIFDDIASQQDFGIKSLVMSGGERVTETAFNWARAALKDSKSIRKGEAVNILSQDSISIEVECLGYWHALKWLPYISIAKTGSIQAHEVIIEVLEYFNSINQGWLPQDFDWLDYNFRTERRGYSSLQSCQEVITNIINEGGLGGERWVGGFYQDRNFLYKSAEDLLGLYSEHFDLYRTLDDAGQMIFDSALGTEVKPWDMVPDRHLQTLDDLADDMYIEQITYIAPYGLTLIGGDDQRLSIYLSQKGLPSL